MHADSVTIIMVLFQSHERTSTYNIWRAPYLIISRTGDPRENCWRGEGRESFHSFWFQGGTWLKFDPKADFLASKTFLFYTFPFFCKIAMVNYVVCIKEWLIHSAKSSCFPIMTSSGLHLLPNLHSRKYHFHQSILCLNAFSSYEFVAHFPSYL